VIEAEAAVELEARPPQVAEPTGAPQHIQLNSNAILITLPAGKGPLRILTPHAIASVRGTTYVVDATDGKTAVFVIEGVVAVMPTNLTSIPPENAFILAANRAASSIAT